MCTLRVSGFGFSNISLSRSLSLSLSVKVFGIRDPGSGFRDPGLRNLSVDDLCMLLRSGVRVSGSGFRDEGLGFRA